MATATIPSPCLKSNLTRREALRHSAPALVAVGALPAVVLAEHSLGAGRMVLATGTDPHVAWWAEVVEIRAEQDAYEEFDDDQSARESEVEKLIGRTPPTTPEGAAIIAAMIIAGHKLMYPDGRGMEYIEVEDRAGETLARHVLAGMPADVLVRAGLEAWS